jgi:7-cyano-7-deazaguanine reductase
MNTIEEIASVHLGKAGDGSVVKPYVTPDDVDPSLLVRVPRQLNRTHYEIEEKNLPFVGGDVWNCYEFSTLLNNGFPLSGALKIYYSANSKYIVESKSLKLYLNSFNMAKMAEGIDTAKVIVRDKIENDLSKLLETRVLVKFHREGRAFSYLPQPFNNYFWFVDDIIDLSKTTFEAYNEDPSLLKVVSSNSNSDTRYHTNSLRSNCRVTNQPDWGDVFILIRGEKTITPDSFLKYIVSMRKENHFHEEICECIYKRLHDLLNPDELFVACLYTRRGGIDINPVRASSDVLLESEASSLISTKTMSFKTMRQ